MLDRGQGTRETHAITAPVESFGAGQIQHDAQVGLARAADLDGGHIRSDAQPPIASVDLERGQELAVTQMSRAALNPLGAGQSTAEAHKACTDAMLLISASALDDLERIRIASENRARALAQEKGLAGSEVESEQLALVAALDQLEHRATLTLQRTMRKHPLGPWVKRTVGIGEKQGARLLAAIGDPLRYVDQDGVVQNRTVSKLWAYCGYAPGQKRQKGVKANWNATAKMRAFLCAESCIKQIRSPYRLVYDARRAHTAETNPDWTAGHSHNDALRIVAKAILKGIWLEARATEHAATNLLTPAPLESAVVA